MSVVVLKKFNSAADAIIARRYGWTPEAVREIRHLLLEGRKFKPGEVGFFRAMAIVEALKS